MSDRVSARSGGGRSWRLMVSMSPRSAVIGVRISWEASAAKRRCSLSVERRRPWAPSRRASIRFIARASPPTSSARPSGTRSDGSWLSATRWAAAWAWASGRSAGRTTTRARPVAIRAATRAAVARPRATSSSVSSTSVRGRATATVLRPPPGLGSSATTSRR